jgi:uncharacterized membrane protein YoaK (UPF0700 family)
VSKPWSVLVADPKHGPLPALLLGLTVVTGLVDAVSVLSLGRVFVANMTGNVVFVGFALAGFLVGAWAGGLVHTRAGGNRGRLLFNSMLLELALLAIAGVIAQVQAVPYSRSAADAIAGVAAVGMGLQNATARQLAVPDLTTSVVTMTLTGLATEVRARNRSTIVRRVLAVVTMLGGAVVGALLVLHVRPSASLEVAAGLVAVVTVATASVIRQKAAWQSA